MPGFKPVEIEERELEAELKSNPGLLEPGMTFLDHQVPTGRGFIDLLCADKDGTPSIIELKIQEDDGMLTQALDYVDWTNENIDRLVERYSKLANEEARVVLVAPSFSERLRRSSKYVSPSIELVEFEYLQTEKGEKGLRIRRVDVGPIKTPLTPSTIEDHLGYIRNSTVNELARKIVAKIQSLDPTNIELKPTQYYLGFQYKNRNIAAIHAKRNNFDLDYYDADDWYSITIAKEEDFTEEVFNKIKARFTSLAK